MVLVNSNLAGMYSVLFSRGLLTKTFRRLIHEVNTVVKIFPTFRKYVVFPMLVRRTCMLGGIGSYEGIRLDARFSWKVNILFFVSCPTGIKDMANLNFQQPPRSITSQSLSRNAFNSSSLSGHVTPTSNMFPGAAANSFTPQQLSPSRNIPPMGSRSLFNPPRSFTERRPVQPVGSVIQDWLVFFHASITL